MNTTHNTSLQSFARFAGIVCGLWVLLNVNTAHAEYLDRLMLLDLLRSSQFEKLDQTLSQQERLYHQGKIPEQHLEAAYLSFANSNPDLASRFNEWVEKEGSPGFAYLARGIYYWHLGWVHRGNRYVNETPQERIRDMRTYFPLATKDLHNAILAKSGSSIAYAYRIYIATTLGNQEEIEHFTLEGLQRNPKSFAIRWKYLASLLPWWSGLSSKDSLNMMKEFVRETVGTQSLNLEPLRGYPDYVRAEILARERQQQEAIPYYKKSLAHGPYYWFSYEQGNNYFYMGQYEAAYEAFTQALHDRPQTAAIHKQRAKTLAKLGKNKQALEEFQVALQLDGYNPDILTNAAYVLTHEGRYHEAIDLLRNALIHGKYDEYVVEKLGRIYLYNLHQPAEGLEFLRRATELNPERHNYWYNYGLALYQLNKCEAVEAFHHYQARCEDSQKCSEKYLNWAKLSTKHILWDRGCWRHVSIKNVIQGTFGYILPF